MESSDELNGSVTGGPLEEIEEIVEPVLTPDYPDPMAVGAIVETPNGCRLRVVVHCPPSRAVRLYETLSVDDETKIALQEALSEEGRQILRRNAEILRTVSLPMVAPLVEFWESPDRAWLATPYRFGRTLADELAAGSMPLEQALPILAQIAYALARLHADGWVHLGVRPQAIVVGKPVTLLCFEDALHIGETPPKPFYYTGYSAPELLTGQPAHPRADIYALGAILYHVVNSEPIAETGIELTCWSPSEPVAGTPQIVHRCLGPLDSRYTSMDELHRDLLKLSRRLKPAVHHRVAWSTSIGLEPSRTTNQDACGFIVGGAAGEDGPLAWALVCVSDGMGGMAAGEVASQVAVRAVLKAASTALPAELPVSVERQADLVNLWAEQANKGACEALAERGVRGGATFLCALVVGTHLTVAHIGDSRLYLVRDGEATVLTRDHSLAMLHVMRGEIGPEQLRTHPDRNRVARSLGERDPLPAHYIDSLETLIGKRSFDLQAGDVIAACSDGVWEPVLDENLAALVNQHRLDLDEAADAIVRNALDRGAPDNATVVLLALSQGSRQEKLGGTE